MQKKKPVCITTTPSTNNAVYFTTNSFYEHF